MGKNKTYKKGLKRFFRKNPVLLALAGGTAWGLVAADALGLAKKVIESKDETHPSEKVKHEMLDA